MRADAILINGPCHGWRVKRNGATDEIRVPVLRPDGSYRMELYAYDGWHEPLTRLPEFEWEEGAHKDGPLAKQILEE